MYTAYCSCTASDLKEAYRSVQRVYKNATYSRLFATTWDCRERFRSRTPSVQRLTRPPSSCTVSVHSLLHLYGVRLQGTVQIRTAGVRRCRSLHIVCHDLVNCRERFRSRTPSVQRLQDLPVCAEGSDTSWNLVHFAWNPKWNLESCASKKSY